MSLSCFFGHKWNGCKCTICGKIREEGHDWSQDCEKCSICQKVKIDVHKWNGCKCILCGKVRDIEHDYDVTYVCQKCKHIDKDRAYASFRTAIENNDIELVKKFLSNGLDVEYVDKGLRGIYFMPITDAVEHGQLSILKLMIESGANVKVREYRNYSLLHHANSSSKIVEYLVKLGLDVNDTNNELEVEPLYNAKTAEVVDSLVNAGAKIDYASYVTGYWTPLRVAIENNRVEVISALLKHGADVHAKDALGDTPISRFRNSDLVSNQELMKLIEETEKEQNKIEPNLLSANDQNGSIKALAKTYDQYVDDCFTFTFPELLDNRNWQQIPDAKSIVDAKRAGNVDEAISLALDLKKKSPDYYFPYYWLIYLFSNQAKYNEAEAALLEGLQFAKQKQDICDVYANSKWQENNLGEAVKWWIRSVVLQLSSNNIVNDNPFLYLSYVAESLGCWNICAELRVIVDRLTMMGRLNTTAISKICDATSQQGNSSMKMSIETLSKEFLNKQ